MSAYTINCPQYTNNNLQSIQKLLISGNRVCFFLIPGKNVSPCTQTRKNGAEISKSSDLIEQSYCDLLIQHIEIILSQLLASVMKYKVCGQR